MKEMAMILEQILPWFNPYRNITIQEWDFLPELTRDLKVTLKSTTPLFMDDVAEEQIKKVEFTLEFEIDVFMYKPIPLVELIKVVRVPFIDWTNETVPVSADMYMYSVSGDSLDNYTVLEDYTWPSEVNITGPMDGGEPGSFFYGGDPQNIHGGTPGSLYAPVGGLPYGRVLILDGGEEV
jgi:hypothetical protein